MKLIKPKDLLEYGMSPSTAAKLRMRGGGPPFVRVGRSVRYLAEDLEAWAKANRALSNAEAVERSRTADGGHAPA